MEKKEDIDIRIIKSYLMDEKDSIKLKEFLRLYSNYSKLNKFNYGDLNEFEKETYTIEGRTLTDKERIKKEIVIIKSAIKKINDKKVKDYVETLLNDIELIINYDDNVFEGYIPYLKESICILQSILNLDINFYNASCELFNNEYEKVKKNILNDKINNIRR